MLSCGPSEYRHGRQKLINHYICVIWVERFQNKNKMLHENCSLCPYKAILRFETTRHFKSEMNWCLYIINSKFIWCFSLIYINDYIYNFCSQHHRFHVLQKSSNTSDDWSPIFFNASEILCNLILIFTLL